MTKYLLFLSILLSIIICAEGLGCPVFRQFWNNVSPHNRFLIKRMVNLSCYIGVIELSTLAFADACVFSQDSCTSGTYCPCIVSCLIGSHGLKGILDLVKQFIDEQKLMQEETSQLIRSEK